MFNEVVTDTNIVYYLMIAVGAVGVLSKAVNQITLRRLVRAAGNMSKSTHKLIKLVRAKYEHALMLHDRVENAEAFVEKYIYEYRGFLLRIHTWRQIEVQSIWFPGFWRLLEGSSGTWKMGFVSRSIVISVLGRRKWSFCLLSARFRTSSTRLRRPKTTWWIIWKMSAPCAAAKPASRRRTRLISSSRRPPRPSAQMAGIPMTEKKLPQEPDF